MSAGEVRRTERWLASARVFLAISALAAILMDPAEIHFSIWVFALLAFYIAQGMMVIIFLRRRQQSTASFRVLVHAGDIVWPALISIFAAGTANPFFLFFIFVLAAAAYRWGLWETVGTAAAAVSLLWIETLAFHWGVIGWVSGVLLRSHLPGLSLDVAYFVPKALFMRSIYLLVMGWLLGYLAEQQKQLRAEKAVIARTLGKARVDAGLTGTLQEIGSELLSMYGAKQIILASQEASNRRVYVGEAHAGSENFVSALTASQKSGLKDLIAKLENGLKASFGYSGARSVTDLWSVASFGYVSPQGTSELGVHSLTLK